jgi:hypothetical protein
MGPRAVPNLPSSIPEPSVETGADAGIAASEREPHAVAARVTHHQPADGEGSCLKIHVRCGLGILLLGRIGIYYSSKNTLPNILLEPSRSPRVC